MIDNFNKNKSSDGNVEQPSVTVLLSTYNGSKYIESQIISIMEQKYVDVYLYVRDDGSTDNTVTILEKMERLYFGRIFVFKDENIGWRKSYNQLMKMNIKTKFIAFSDQDDIWRPDKLITAINALNEEKIALYICNANIVDERLNFIRLHCEENKNMLDRSIEKILIDPQMPGGLVYVFNYKTLEKVRKIIHMDSYGHDTLVFQVCFAIGSIVYDCIPHIEYRQHDSNVFGASLNRKEFLKERIHILLNGNSCSLVKLIKEIYYLYYDEINESNKDIMELMSKMENSIIHRMIFIKKYDIGRDKFVATFLLKLKILLGLL